MPAQQQQHSGSSSSRWDKEEEGISMIWDVHHLRPVPRTVQVKRTLLLISTPRVRLRLSSDGALPGWTHNTFAGSAPSTPTALARSHQRSYRKRSSTETTPSLTQRPSNSSLTCLMSTGVGLSD